MPYNWIYRFSSLSTVVKKKKKRGGGEKAQSENTLTNYKTTFSFISKLQLQNKNNFTTKYKSSHHSRQKEDPSQISQPGSPPAFVEPSPSPQLLRMESFELFFFL